MDEAAVNFLLEELFRRLSGVCCLLENQEKSSFDGCLPACLPACLPVCLPACLPACLPGCIPACLSAFSTICLPTCSNPCFSAWLFPRFSVCPLPRFLSGSLQDTSLSSDSKLALHACLDTSLPFSPIGYLFGRGI